MTPVEGRTPAGMTLKVKQELGMDVDAFIIGTAPAKMEYTGKEIESWTYWYDTQREVRLPEGMHYADFVNGKTIIAVTKSFYYELPGAIECAVFDDNGEVYPICKCSNLTDELSEDLRDNFDEYYMKPCKIQGMMLSHNKNDDSISIRHPKLMGLRDDIDVTDCTLTKVIGG